MAEALAIAEAGWVASPIITSLLKNGFSYLGVGISTKLQDLETTILPQFQLVIDAAERSSEDKVKLQSWLKRLKDAVYEAEDVLDLYKYQLLEEKVSDLNSTRPALKPFKKVARKVNSKLSIFSHQKIKLRKSLNKLEVIAAEARTFCKLLEIGRDGMVSQYLRDGGQPDTSTSFPLHKVLGRDEERNEIINKYLLDSSEASEPRESYSVVAIVGIGGSGKTTLAQLIYNDPRVAAHFDVKMWVCVSRKLDVSRHTREMIEYLSMSKRLNFKIPGTIQEELVELVNSKKVLLVLDDVWYDGSTNEMEWQNFLAPLAKSVKSGSKVLVTTRTTILPVALRPQYSMALEDLEENDILSLFKLHAFDGTKLDDSHLQDELMTIGKQIVRKLHGSPLAAKAVGCQLGKTLTVGAWKAALEQDNLRDSQQALLWSYQRLDAPLQRCFSYFSLFPKGHKYQAEEMVQLWIAEGFINSFNNSKRMEDIGMEYFDELVSGSFLQHVEDDTKYYMHDLLHDLAEKISNEDCLRIEEDDQITEIPRTIRRLSISGRHTSNIGFNKLVNLHSLIIDGSLSPPAIANLFAAIERSKKLRVLSLFGMSREKLAELLAKTKHFKHLRFLGFNWSGRDELPATLGKLYRLEVLIVKSGDASLPRSLRNLINLRHFIGDVEALALLPDIGRLTYLQTLPKFIVKKEKGHDIGQLKNLYELRGRLKIYNLLNVEGKDKAAEANLRAKSHLKQLHLEWDKDDDVESDCRSDLDMEVLEGLQPHPNLIELTICRCQSPRFPNWLLHLTALTHLNIYSLLNISSLSEHLPQSLSGLHLHNCPSISSLPEHLPQSLSGLHLHNCPSISSLPEHLPQSLRELYLDNCPSISSLPEHLPQSLRELYLDNCPSISSLPEHLPQLLNSLLLWDCPSISSLPEHLPQSLRELYLHSCPSISSLSEHLPQSLREIYLDNCPSISSLPEHLPQSLNSLHLWDCPSISSLPEHLPQSLNNLKLSNCPSISSLPEHLPQSLNSLYLWHCDSISSLPEHLPQSLIELHLHNYHSISSLPEHLPQSLKRLDIWNCSSISSLPEHLPQLLNRLDLSICSSISTLSEHLPQSLKAISIKRCQILEEQCRSPNGEDWPKIAPRRDIPSGAAVEI